MSALEKAIKNAGGQGRLAELLGIKQGAVGNWVMRKRVPAERVLQIESTTGVSRHQLRPDLYPIEKRA